MGKRKGVYRLPCWIFLAFIGFLLFASQALCDRIPDRPANYVTDLADIVDARTEQRLNLLLRELEQKTTAQFAVLTVNSLEGKSIEAVSLHVAHDLWRLGQKTKDNGLLLLVAVKDRKYRFEVGYGLEPVLPDSFVGTVGRRALAPHFKRGDYSGGILAAMAAAADAVAKDAGVTLSGMPKSGPIVSRGGRAPQQVGLLAKIVGGIVFFILLLVFIRHPRLFLYWFIFSSMGGRRGGTWGSGSGGFGGGGFGGFSGGGGGFGGGGASGGW